MMRSMVMAILCLSCLPACAHQLAVANFTYVDTSQEPRDQREAHRARLQAFMARLRDGLGDRATVLALPTDADITVARTAGIGLLVTGGVQKLSTLVEYARVQLSETTTGRELYGRTYSFRGDNDEAWNRAATFIAADLCSQLSAPIR